MHVFLLKHILAFVSLCEKSPLLSLSYLSNIGNAPALLLICLAWCTHGICFISYVELASLKSLQYFNYTGFMGLSLCSIHPLSDDMKKRRSAPLLSGSSHLFSPQNSTSCHLWHWGF
uniref:Uncharacterized protein n=1 Tax=Aquila chrysaetos chrysaetos TaxID=223781 RepID=A0A663EC54_AQUCH